MVFTFHFCFSISYIDLFSERRTKSKHAEAFKSPAQTSGPETVESQPKLDSSSKTTEVPIPTPLNKDPSQEPPSEPEVISERHIADFLVQFEGSTPQDDRNLFPEITSSISAIKTTCQPEMVVEEASFDPISKIVSLTTEVLQTICTSSLWPLNFSERIEPKYAYIFS